MKEQASVCGRFAGSALVACTNQRESLVMDAENLADSSHPHPRADRPVALGMDLCLVVASERFVGRIGNGGSVGHPDWCHSE